MITESRRCFCYDNKRTNRPSLLAPQEQPARQVRPNDRVPKRENTFIHSFILGQSWQGRVTSLRLRMMIGECMTLLVRSSDYNVQESPTDNTWRGSPGWNDEGCACMSCVSESIHHPSFMAASFWTRIPGPPVVFSVFGGGRQYPKTYMMSYSFIVHLWDEDITKGLVVQAIESSHK